MIGITSSGTIGFVGGEAELAASAIDMSSVANKIDMGGRWVTPGLIDCHTHAVHAGNRAAEWELKIGGASYEEVARAGGGIIASISAAREADVESLLDQSHARISRSVAHTSIGTDVGSNAYYSDFMYTAPKPSSLRNQTTNQTTAHVDQSAYVPSP